MDPIKDLLHLYSDAVCRQDADQWTNTWCESGLWDLGHGEPVSGKENLRSFWINSMSRFEKVIHTYSNSISHLESHSGTGRAYVTEWLKEHLIVSIWVNQICLVNSSINDLIDSLDR